MKISEKIRALSTTQAIVIAALIISFTFVVSSSFNQIKNIFCDEDCLNKKLKLSESCNKLVLKRTGKFSTAKIKNDMYKKCLNARGN